MIPARERRFALTVTSHRGSTYLPATLELARQMLPWDRLEPRIVVDDAGGAPDPLDCWTLHFDRRSGLSEAVSTAWAIAARSGADYVFHLEEDFQLCEPVDLDGMADVVDRDGLAQMCLLRQPWSPDEVAADGYQQSPAYEQRDEYLFHREGFWLNPSLIPADVVAGGGGVESVLTERWSDRGFGVWGQRGDPPRCLHVGELGGMGSPGWQP